MAIRQSMFRKSNVEPKGNDIKPNTRARELGQTIGDTTYVIYLQRKGVDKVNALHKLGRAESAPINSKNYLTLLAIDKVFSTTTGHAATKHELLEAFGTSDMAYVVKSIVANGKYQDQPEEPAPQQSKAALAA